MINRFTTCLRSRQYLRRMLTSFILMTAGAVISAVEVVIFMLPAEVVPGGVTSLAVILNAVIGSPVGVVVLLANIPIQYWGARMLGGWRTLAGTIYAIAVFSILVEVLVYAGVDAVSDDRLLNAVFGGVLGGIAGGLIYLGGATLGGTSTVAQILRDRTGTPMSTTFLYTDTIFIIMAAFVFGWESALYAVVALVLNGMATDYVLEGPSVIRTVTIITNQPEAISAMVIHDLDRTVTAWEAEGMYTHQPRTVLFVTVSRAEAGRLKDRVQAIDPTAFIVIGQGHAAYGEGFRQPSAAIPPETPTESA
ncbi:MAG: YitT family protein [Anaerolineae bacterium]|nr:YitT family protein [Anaerolineae bacterium]